MTEVQITLDKKSIDILKGVDKIHRDSIINIGLALVSKTGYYATLTGKNSSEELDDIASLDINDQDTPSKSTKTKKVEASKAPKASTSWDAF